MGLLPIEQVEYGVNYACFSNGEKRFICSCQKKSIVNRLRLYEKYFCKLGYYDIMTGITYGANDPELKKKVLGLPPALERQIDFTRDIIEQIDFKPYICHNCNNASVAFFSPMHPKSKKWRDMPYRLNFAISFGIYPCKSLPPKKGRYYFILDDALIFPAVRDCTFSGAILNSFQYRNKGVLFDWCLSSNNRFDKDAQRRMICVPGRFGTEIESLVYWDLFDVRRSIKAKMNSLIDALLSPTPNLDDIIRSQSEEKKRIYDYVIKDGKIVMDKILEPFFRADLAIYLEHARIPSVLGFCFKIRAYNRFFEAIEHVSVERIADEIIFAPNVIENANRLEFYFRSNYFRLLARGIQIVDNYTVHLQFLNRCDEKEVLRDLFDMTEELGLQNRLIPIIRSFYKKRMNISYYDIKRDYAPLLLHILSFPANQVKNTAKDFFDAFNDAFSNEFKETNIQFSQDDLTVLYFFVKKYLDCFIDEEICLRKIRSM